MIAELKSTPIESRTRQTVEEKKDKAKWSRILRVYGLSREQYQSLLTSFCRICLREYGGTIRPVIDHDHTTGEVRGIICGYCNHRHIGRHRDSSLLHRMATYIAGPHTGWIVPEKPKKKRRSRKKGLT